MLASSLIPAQWRSGDAATPASNPRWYDRHVSPALVAISRRAWTHPIHTIVFFAFLASTTYVGLLESSLFEQSEVGDGALGRADFNSLLSGSRRLHVGPETAWKWQLEEVGSENKAEKTSESLALITLVFPGSSAGNEPKTAPGGREVHLPSNLSAELLPSSPNPLSPISHDTTLAFYLPYDQAPELIASLEEIPAPSGASQPQGSDVDGTREEKMWIMRATRSNELKGLRRWMSNAWSSFLDLLKNAESLDIVIMSLGYITMHLTFVSLFLSMRRLGSNFWLATTVLFNSVFAFLFGLTVTNKFGVPINMVLLSEGLPFLVVTVGFEKPIGFTKAVLSASLDLRRQEAQDGTLPTIQNAIQRGVQEHGYETIRDYFIEIVILIAGAASGVQGGLTSFCFLAAWILFFDGLLLFTFYTAILTVKLEINRIKRHVALRKALEDDGVSHRVAERVASSNDWPGPHDAKTSDPEYSVFGRKIRESSIPKFKVIMVSGFLMINFLNLCTIPFRGAGTKTPPAVSGLSSVVTQPPMDPFKVAGNGLDHIFASTKSRGALTTVTVLAPIKYDLQYPSVHYATAAEARAAYAEDDYADIIINGVGGRVVEGVLKSLEDPVLSKWFIVALGLSLILNGYLFNAARWTIKDPPTRTGDGAAAAAGRREEKQGEAPVANGKAVASAREEEPNVEINVVPPTLPEGAPASASRTFEECLELHQAKETHNLTDEEVIMLAQKGKIPGHGLEKAMVDKTRAVRIRRALTSRTKITKETSTLLEKSKLPYLHFDYDTVHGACCENVVGYMPLPVGLAGPLAIDGKNYFLPMATTEGVLVASTSRGCKAINMGGGAVTVVTGDGMTRGPCVSFDTLSRAGAAKLWLDSEDGQRTMRAAFNSTSSYARLQSMKTAMAGTNLYIRFKTTTGDAMGMNMISKGVEKALHVMADEGGFADMRIISVSGNYCTDKKPAAINWIDGRGKSVVAEAIIPEEIVLSVLKSTVDALVELNINKNLIGSAMAGSIGGFNAHAANIVAAMFIATGQDPAQVVESANCITTMKNLNGALHIAVSLPSIEVGTLGGGTILDPQGAMLDLLGVRGPHPTSPGENARTLARVIAAAVLAGELSLCSALAAGHLVRAHMQHNRSQVPSRSGTPGPQSPIPGTPGAAGAGGGAAAGGSGGQGAQTPVGLAMTSMREAARGGKR